MSKDSYPFAGNPRMFRAVAMPNGDARYGIEGQLVFVCEQRGGCVDRPKFLSRAEAEQLHAALDAALRTFALGAELAADPDRASSGSAVGEQERARPYLGPYPIRGKTLAEIDAEARGEAA